jgi:hypothetical protein
MAATGGKMSIPNFWEADLRMLQCIVELQAIHGGIFSTDILIDHVTVLHPADLGDTGTALSPWAAAESLRRLDEAGLVLFIKDSEDPVTPRESNWLQYWAARGSSVRAERIVQKWQRTKDHRIAEAFYKGVPSRGSEDTELAVSAYWHDGRFYINEKLQLYSVRATTDGLRRVGAWPNPERFTEVIVATLGDIAESIEAKRPEDAKMLRQIGRIVRANAIELSTAVLTKLLEHAAGL